MIAESVGLSSRESFSCSGGNSCEQPGLRSTGLTEHLLLWWILEWKTIFKRQCICSKTVCVCVFTFSGIRGRGAVICSVCVCVSVSVCVYLQWDQRQGSCDLLQRVCVCVFLFVVCVFILVCVYHVCVWGIRSRGAVICSSVYVCVCSCHVCVFTLVVCVFVLAVCVCVCVCLPSAGSEAGELWSVSAFKQY